MSWMNDIWYELQITNMILHVIYNIQTDTYRYEDVDIWSQKSSKTNIPQKSRKLLHSCKLR